MTPDVPESLTRSGRGDYILCVKGFPMPSEIVKFVKFWGVSMCTLQRLAAISDATANLIAQVRELREQVRKAEQAQRSLRLEPRSQLTLAAQESKTVGRRSRADKSKESNLERRRLC